MHKELEQRFKGRVEHTRHGPLLVFEKKLEDLDAGRLGEYIQAHSATLTKIRRVVPQLARVPKNKMLFFDTENCGLHYRDPVFLIGSCQIADGLSINCMFARDYSEERAVISSFIDSLADYDAIFTYNGKTFDVPRLDERAKQNGIPIKNQGHKTLTEMLAPKHIDLLPLARRHIDFPSVKRVINGKTRYFPDAKLQTFEKIILKYSRTGDIHGSEVPRAYHEYVYGADEYGIKIDESRALDRLSQVIHHNMLDTISMFAVLSYLCS